MAITKTLYEKVIEQFPNDLEAIKNAISLNQIVFQNDSDGSPDYIAVWDFVKPLPTGFKVGK